MNDYFIRAASEDDVPRILEIYAPYIRESTATFEYDVPSKEEFSQRFKRITRRYPYLVCEQDGGIIGYAYADTFMIRPAYDWTCEVSIYMDINKRGMGAGKLLYSALFEQLKAMNIKRLYAVITQENTQSLAFHSSLGFKTFAIFKKSGYKMGRWLDVNWMELEIGDCDAPPGAVIWRVGG